VARDREQYSGKKKGLCSGESKVNAVYSKMPVGQRYLQSRDAKKKKIVSAIDVRMQARSKWNRQLMQPDTSIGYPNRWKIGIDGRSVAMEDW
jgi:hypothetical protein